MVCWPMQWAPAISDPGTIHSAALHCVLHFAFHCIALPSSVSCTALTRVDMQEASPEWSPGTEAAGHHHHHYRGDTGQEKLSAVISCHQMSSAKDLTMIKNHYHHHFRGHTSQDGKLSSVVLLICSDLFTSVIVIVIGCHQLTYWFSLDSWIKQTTWGKMSLDAKDSQPCNTKHQLQMLKHVFRKSRPRNAGCWSDPTG